MAVHLATGRVVVCASALRWPAAGRCLGSAVSSPAVLRATVSGRLACPPVLGRTLQGHRARAGHTRVSPAGALGAGNRARSRGGGRARAGWVRSAWVPALCPLQGDVQQLLISPDPRAAFRACDGLLPGCDTPSPTPAGVSATPRPAPAGPGLGAARS